MIIVNRKKNSLKNFLWLISLSGVLHVDEVRVVFAFLVVGERGVVADPIVSHLDSEVEKRTEKLSEQVQNIVRFKEWHLRVKIHSRK